MRAYWLEPHDLFEGVGAHELNFRYDHVDDVHEDFDPPDDIVADPTTTPALSRAIAHFASVNQPGRLDGADTSHYQPEAGPFDLTAARATGLTWWAHKVSQSTLYIDPTWHTTATTMQSQHFRNTLGYHWVSSVTDPDRQAAWLLACMGDTARVMGVMGDCEEQQLTPERCLAFYEAVEASTHRPCAHYTGAYVGAGRIFADTRLRDSKYGPRPVVLAAYVPRSKMLTLPNVARLGIHAWQYSSNGPVVGVTGRCDMDEVSDPAAFDLACHGQVTTVDPPVEVEPPTVQPVTAVPNPKEEPVRFVADSQSKGSAAVELVYGADKQPHHTMVGFDTQAERDVWAAALPVHAFDDATYLAMAASASA